MRAVLTCLVAGALFMSATDARAQAPQGFQRLTAADVAESLAVLRRLDSVVRKNKNDAAAWHRRGMVAWALAARDKRQPPIRGIDWTLLDHMADTSLRLAALIEPTNIYYKLAVGRHLASTFGPVNRTAAKLQYGGAMTAVRRSGSPMARADAALEAGRLHFRMYESIESVRLRGADVAAAIAGQGDAENADRRALTASEIREVAGPSTINGETDYLSAEALYREAFEAVPNHPRAYGHMATLLVARNRWNELAALARGRIALESWDASAWMWLGLATHRLGDTKTPVIAFESAFARMSPSELAHFDRLDRVMRPADSARFAGLTAAERAATERMYWLYADPLWSREGSEPRIEFLARLSYAQLRWNMPEFSVVGIDSDRGKTLVRFGPPAIVNTVTAPEGTQIAWAYNTGLSFVFRGYNIIEWLAPDAAKRLIDASPVRWDNMASVPVDSMPAQAVRFRAGDSVALLVAAKPAVATIQQTAEVTNAVRAYFWLMAGGTIVAANDSMRVEPDSVVTLVRRLAPGNYVYRAEASAEGARRAGRFTGVIVAGNDSASGFTMSGFGMSDVLLATTVTPANSPVARWTDIAVTPLAGPAPARAPVSLVWENYDLAVRDGAARYTIAITLQRERSRAGAIAANIAGAIGITRTDDHVTMQLERAVPGAPVIVEQITLNLDDTPPGSYRLIVEITDAVTGRRTSRMMRLVLAG